MEEEEEEIVGSDFIDDDEDQSVEALELKLKKILEEKEQLERKKKKGELLAKIKQAKAEVSTLHTTLQPTQQEIDKWTEEELKNFFKTKGITIKNNSINHLQSLAKSVSEAKIPDFEIKATRAVDRRTIKLNGNSLIFPEINDSSMSDWYEELSSLPSIDHVVAHAYIISSADYDIERFKNLRQEEAYSLYKGSSVRKLKGHDLHEGHIYIKACCCSSNNDINNSEEVWSLVRDDGIIQSAGCSCAADTGCCKHVVAFLLTLASLNKSNSPINDANTTKLKDRSSPKSVCNIESSMEHKVLKTHQDTKSDIKTNQSCKLVYGNDSSDDSEGEPEIWIPPRIGERSKDKKDSVVQAKEPKTDIPPGNDKSTDKKGLHVLKDTKTDISPRNDESSTDKKDYQARDTKTDNVFIPSMSIKHLSTVAMASNKSSTPERKSTNSICQVKPKQGYTSMDVDRITCKQTLDKQDSELISKIEQNVQELKMASGTLSAPKPKTSSQRTKENYLLGKTSAQLETLSTRPYNIPIQQSIQTVESNTTMIQPSMRSVEFKTVKLQPSVKGTESITSTLQPSIHSTESDLAMLHPTGYKIEPLQYPDASSKPTNSYSYSASYQPIKYPSSSENIDCYSNERSGIPVTIPYNTENAFSSIQVPVSGNVYPRLVYPSPETTDVSQKVLNMSEMSGPSPIYPSAGTTNIVQKNAQYSSVTPLTTDIISGTISSKKPFVSSRIPFPEHRHLVYPSTSESCQQTMTSSSGMTTQKSSSNNSIGNPSGSFSIAQSVNSRSQTSNDSPVCTSGFRHYSPQSPYAHPVASQLHSENIPFGSRQQAPLLECSPVVKNEFRQKTAQISQGKSLAAEIYSERKPVANSFLSSDLRYPYEIQATASRLVYPSMESSENIHAVQLSSNRVPTNNDYTPGTRSNSLKDSQTFIGYHQSNARIDQAALQDKEQILLKTELHQSVIKHDNVDNTRLFEPSDISRDNTREKVNRRDRFRSPQVTSRDEIPFQEAIPHIPFPDTTQQKKITYDREFLLKLRKSKFARRKPDISHLPENMIAEISVNFNEEDIRTARAPLPSNWDVGYVKGAPKGVVKCKKHRQDRSNSPKQVKHPHSADDRGRPSYQVHSSKTRQLGVKPEGLQIDVVNDSLQETATSTEDIMRKAIGAFNMLKNGCDSSQVVEMISSLSIQTEDCLSRIVSLLVETVIEDPGLTSVCSSISRVLARAKVPSCEGVLTFSTAYRQKCEKEIELGIFSRSDESYQRRIEELTRFTSSISRMVLLKPCDIHVILMKLYTTGSEICLMCFCTLLVDVWDRMERCISQNYIDQYCDIIEEIKNTEPTEAMKYKISQLNRKRKI